MKKTFLQKNKGYTLLETMVATSIFIVVLMMGMAALLNMNLLHQKSHGMRSIMDNLNFITEDMSRNLRTGYMYKCFRRGVDAIPPTLATISAAPTTRTCADGLAIAFESTTPVLGNPAVFTDQWVYYIDTAVINGRTIGRIWKSTTGTNTPAVQLTPDEIDINEVASSFAVLGAEGISTDTQQPFVTIRLVGTITYKGVDTPFSLQTSVSQRSVDI